MANNIKLKAHKSAEHLKACPFCGYYLNKCDPKDDDGYYHPVDVEGGCLLEGNHVLISNIPHWQMREE